MKNLYYNLNTTHFRELAVRIPLGYIKNRKKGLIIMYYAYSFQRKK